MEYRKKMNPRDRAKQFMPFAALKGYPEALHEKEKIFSEKPVFSQEYEEELNRRLLSVRKNDIVTVVYFCDHEYVKITGIVTAVNYDLKTVRIVKTTVFFHDICSLQKPESGQE